MSRASSNASKEGVLGAFAVEQDHSRETLERYLRLYPQFAGDLIDLSRAIHTTVPEDDAPLSAADEAMIEAAWQQHQKAISTADPLGRLSTEELRNIARYLGVPRQVVAAFQEHRVILTTVPARFLERLAAAARTTVDLLTATLSAPPSATLARSFKADQTPQSEGAVSFERLLTDAGVSEADRARLMSEAD